MTEKWKKLGLTYCPSKRRHPKLYSHAANPLPIHLHDDVFRVFYSGRDQQNRSSVGAVDIDIIRNTIVNEHHDPFFVHGSPGSFYADGVSIGNCYSVDGITYMLFMGWQNPENRHWRGDIGRLIVQPDLSLQPEKAGPFMSSDSIDPLSLSYPWVLQNGDHSYKMWYGSTHTWDAGNKEMIHVINYACSHDGNTWHRQGLALPYKIGVAQAFSRPSVVQNPNGSYEMWFSYRSGSGETYRIGYASSLDGNIWHLDLENTGITVSLHGWDAEMIEYPFVFDHAGQRFMLYNGNSYGKTGFGLAVLSNEEY